MHCKIANISTWLDSILASPSKARSSCRAPAGPRQRLQNTKDARSHSRELHEAPERPPRATLGRFSALFGPPGAPKISFSPERYSEIVTFAISAQATSSEVQNTPEMVSETPPELPKTLPRAPREVPGASPRPLGSGPRRLQRHLSSARDLRSTLEAALKAFRARFWCKLRAPSLLFFLFSCPWPLPPRRLLEPSRAALGRFRLAFGAPVD